VAARLAPLPWALLASYSVGSYTELTFYLHGQGASHAERATRLALAAGMQIAVSLLLAAELSK
jgi:hypothetical protein